MKFYAYEESLHKKTQLKVKDFNDFYEIYFLIDLYCMMQMCLHRDYLFMLCIYFIYVA